MPKYRITAPDGNTYEITAPEGASEDEVLAYAQQNYQGAKPDFSNVETKVTPGRGASLAAPKRGPVPRTRAELDRVTGTSTQAPSVMGALGGSARDFADSARQGFMRPFHGAAELLQTGTTNALEYAADKAPSTITRGLARMSRDTLESDRQALQQWEADYQARRGGANSTAGEVVGGALPFAVGAPARAGAALMSRIAPAGSGLARQGVAAGTVGGIGGAAAGLADPVQNYENYVEQKLTNTAIGGAAGAAIAPVAGYAPAAIRWIAARFSGPRGAERRMGQRLLEQSGGPVQVQASQVPGVQRTLGDASNNQGLMAYERNLRRQYPQEFTDLDTANNAARVRTLQEIAGDETAMDAAVAAREAQTASLRNQAYTEGTQTQQASSAARRQAAAQAEQEAFRLRSLGLTPPQAAAVAADGKAAVRDNLARLSAENAGRSTVRDPINYVLKNLDQAPDSMDGLYRVRQLITDLISGKGGTETSSARSATRELLQAREMLDAELTARSPSWPAYLSSYQAGSKPINRMEAGRELLSRTGNAGEDLLGNPILSPAKFSTASRNLDPLVQRATGFNKAKASEVFTSEDMRRISAINDDLQRIMRRQANPAQPGSGTMEAGDILKRTARRSVMQAAGRGVPVIEGIADYFATRRESKDLQTLFELYRNPQRAQQVMSQLSKKDRAKLNATLSMLAVGIQANNQEGQ